MLPQGILDLSPWGYVAATLLLTHITIASVTIFLHRHQAHRALTLHPAVSHFFRFWLWLTTAMVTREWVAVHRKHHAKCETPEDPHSPQTRGLAKVLFAGAVLYRREADNARTLENYGSGTPDDWVERRLYSRFPALGIALMLVLDMALFGPVGLAVFLAQMLWIPLWAAGVINGLGHYWGYRNFEPRDASRNLLPVGVVIGGEELHNNHHAFPQSARLSNKWWEFDIGWLYIRTLELFGLAQVKRTAPKTRIVKGKQAVDMDTARAVVRNRFHVLKLYGRQVVEPVLRSERRTAGDGSRLRLARIRTLMTREDVQLDDHGRELLQGALARSQRLQTVYAFKQQLKTLWERSAQDQAKRVQRLQTWCMDAERSGIHVLQEFARNLRGYTLQDA
ncbi:MAG: fatty acid desaturase [Gammaproteobacteria bacterium]